jgi:cytochrome c oxidase subunit III
MNAIAGGYITATNLSPTDKLMRKNSPQLAEDARLLQGAIVLLISLAVFFLGSLILYAIYVLTRIGPEAGKIIPFYLPRGFVLTTVILIAISLILHMAVGAVREERLVDFRRYIVLAFILSLAFFVTQGTGMVWMVQQLMQPFDTMLNLYGFTMFLVLVHALHVIGGVAGLVLLLMGISRDAYDHERHFPVRFCALYWHFLDGVWVIMLLCFGLAAYVSKAP